jgi:hypothetical protein
MVFLLRLSGELPEIVPLSDSFDDVNPGFEGLSIRNGLPFFDMRGCSGETP